MLTSLALLAACSASVDDSPEYYEENAVVQAAVVLEHRVNAEPEGAAVGQAIAGFLSVPANVDPGVAMRLVGFEPHLPEVPGCRALRAEANVSLAEMGRLELLDAGSVEVASGSDIKRLAPRLFPTVTDSIAGLMYTSREPTSAAWQGGARYLVRTTGSASVPALNVAVEAPPTLEGVTVGGTPLGEVSTVRAGEPIDLTWSVGAPGDVVWVELSSEDAAFGMVCAFSDDSGTGTVPASGDVPAGSGTLAMHRSRTIPFAASDQSHGVVRFDFGLSRGVQFVRR